MRCCRDRTLWCAICVIPLTGRTHQRRRDCVWGAGVCGWGLGFHGVIGVIHGAKSPHRQATLQRPTGMHQDEMPAPEIPGALKKKLISAPRKACLLHGKKWMQCP